MRPKITASPNKVDGKEVTQDIRADGVFVGIAVKDNEKEDTFSFLPHWIDIPCISVSGVTMEELKDKVADLVPEGYVNRQES